MEAAASAAMRIHFEAHNDTESEILCGANLMGEPCGQIALILGGERAWSAYMIPAAISGLRLARTVYRSGSRLTFLPSFDVPAAQVRTC